MRKDILKMLFHTLRRWHVCQLLQTVLTPSSYWQQVTSYCFTMLRFAINICSWKCMDVQAASNRNTTEVDVQSHHIYTNRHQTNLLHMYSHTVCAQSCTQPAWNTCIVHGHHQPTAQCLVTSTVTATYSAVHNLVHRQHTMHSTIMHTATLHAVHGLLTVQGTVMHTTTLQCMEPSHKRPPYSAGPVMHMAILQCTITTTANWQHSVQPLAQPTYSAHHVHRNLQCSTPSHTQQTNSISVSYIITYQASIKIF